MKINERDNRRYSRVAVAPSGISEEMPPRLPMIVNMSQGGACIWLSDAPPKERDMALQFRSNGRDQALRSRIVWSRRCMTASDRDTPSLPDSWLAGISFADDNGGTLVTAADSVDLLRPGHFSVSFLSVNDFPGSRREEADAESQARGVIALNEQSVSSFKTAARDLIPVFAKHFSDVSIDFTRHRLRISAAFREPEEVHFPERRVRNHHAIQASLAAQAIAPTRVDHPFPPAQPKREQVMNGRRGELIAMGALVAVIIGGSLYWTLHEPAGKIAELEAIEEKRSIPGLTSTLDQASLNGWLGIQARFTLTDALLRSAIQILQSNDKYTPGQRLHDLSRYPDQVSRAFALLAVPRNEEPVDLGTLQKELQARVVQGVRFPDEAPGGRYSSLQQELFNNVVVLAVIELFYRRQDDPGVNMIVSALQRNR